MTLNGLGTIFMIWWITMGVVKALWDMNNAPKQFKESYKRNGFGNFMTYKQYMKALIIFAIVVWPIALIYDARVKLIKIIHKIKRSF